MQNIDILVADDHDLVRQGFLMMVKSFPFVQSVAGVGNGKEVINHLKSHRPHLILMDMEMPEMDGIETSEKVLERYPDVRIMIVSGFDNEEMIFRAIELGVHGYLLKDAKPEDLKRGIQNVMAKGFHYNDTVVRIMRTGIVHGSTHQKLHPKKELTERDRQLLRLICQEKTTKEIAEDLFLSDRTVEKIRKSLAGKLDVKGTVGLVKFAIKNGYDL
jgi:DNA-binding NarL/FixJ family response regulator